MTRLLSLVTLLTLTSCAPKLTPERAKWAECYCGDVKVKKLTGISMNEIGIICEDDYLSYGYPGKTYSSSCGILE